ncbi:MAG: hypothetical protein ABSA78_11700 [Candidatus Sulfotelmatobacter sp.]|jgi:hypothetical protein
MLTQLKVIEMFGEKKRTSQVFGISNTVQPDSYVDRGALDQQLATLLGRPTHVALRGESKCGKSWLRQRTVPNAITIQCRLDRGAHDLYIDALSQLGIKLVLDNTQSGKISGHAKAEASIGEGLLAKVLGASAVVKAGIEGERGSETRTELVGHDVSDLRFVADLIRASDRRLVIEDFHYLSVAERQKFAFDLKALWDYGLFVVIIGVWSQSNMLIFLNPDLAGRIEEVPIYWSGDDLRRVLKKGGDALNLEFAEDFSAACVNDCYGNAGILQALTLRALDAMGIQETSAGKTIVKDLEALHTSALQYADQLNPLYQQFAKRVSGGIRTRQDSTGIYAYAMAVILEAPDDLALRSISLDYIFQKANAREPRIQKGNLRVVLEKFEQLQVDSEGRGLVVAYNEATAEITVVDRQLLLYRKYSTVKWPWEDLIAETVGKL